MNPRPTLIFLAFGLAAGMVVSCVTSSHPVAPSPLPPKVWPPAPNEPRIAFVESLRGPRDIGQAHSAFRTFANWITGEPVENLDLRKPFAVALDESGNLCLTDA